MTYQQPPPDPFRIVKPVNATPIYKWDPIRGEFVLLRVGLPPSDVPEASQ